MALLILSTNVRKDLQYRSISKWIDGSCPRHGSGSDVRRPIFYLPACRICCTSNSLSLTAPAATFLSGCFASFLPGLDSASPSLFGRSEQASHVPFCSSKYANAHAVDCLQVSQENVSTYSIRPMSRIKNQQDNSVSLLIRTPRKKNPSSTVISSRASRREIETILIKPRRTDILRERPPKPIYSVLL